MADKLGSYEPAFYMAGGAYIVASFIPCVLHCVKKRKTKRKELSPNDEIREDARELEMRSHCDKLCTDEPLKVMQSSNSRQPSEFGQKEFVSTV